MSRNVPTPRNSTHEELKERIEQLVARGQIVRWEVSIVRVFLIKMEVPK